MKITALETIYLPDYPSILVRGGSHGCGVSPATRILATCPTRSQGASISSPHRCLSVHDPLAIELHWRRLYEVIAASRSGRVPSFADFRPVMCACGTFWASQARMPVWRVLGGAGARSHPHLQHLRWPQLRSRAAKSGCGLWHRRRRTQGECDDLPVAFAERPDEPGLRAAFRRANWDEALAVRLRRAFPAGGTAGGRSGACSIRISAQLGRHDISAADLNRILEPFRKIRQVVGEQGWEIMVEGHGLWSLPAYAQDRSGDGGNSNRRGSKRTSTCLDDIDGAYRKLRPGHSMPHSRKRDTLRHGTKYKPLLEKQAADIVMIDPTWAGRISSAESVRDGGNIQAASRNARLHAGPFTLRAQQFTWRSTRPTRSTRNRCGRTCASTTRNW